MTSFVNMLKGGLKLLLPINVYTYFLLFIFFFFFFFTGERKDIPQIERLADANPGVLCRGADNVRSLVGRPVWEHQHLEIYTLDYLHIMWRPVSFCSRYWRNGSCCLQLEMEEYYFIISSLGFCMDSSELVVAVHTYCRSMDPSALIL